MRTPTDSKLLIRASAERVIRFVDLNAPPNLICHEVMLLVRKCFARHGVEMTHAFGSWLVEHARADAGLCVYCGGGIEGVPVSIFDSECKACHEKNAIPPDPDDDDPVKPS